MKEYIKSSLHRIEQAIINNKPKMVDGKAMYMGTHYESLDDAWDWFEGDLEFIKYDVPEILEKEEA